MGRRCSRGPRPPVSGSRHGTTAPRRAGHLRRTAPPLSNRPAPREALLRPRAALQNLLSPRPAVNKAAPPAHVRVRATVPPAHTASSRPARWQRATQGAGCGGVTGRHPARSVAVATADRATDRQGQRSPPLGSDVPPLPILGRRPDRPRRAPPLPHANNDGGRLYCYCGKPLLTAGRFCISFPAAQGGGWRVSFHALSSVFRTAPRFASCSPRTAMSWPEGQRRFYPRFLRDARNCSTQMLTAKRQHVAGPSRIRGIATAYRLHANPAGWIPPFKDALSSNQALCFPANPTPEEVATNSHGRAFNVKHFETTRIHYVPTSRSVPHSAKLSTFH